MKNAECNEISLVKPKKQLTGIIIKSFMSRKIFIIPILAFLLCAQFIQAQQVVSGAALRGVITDTNDALISGVKVTAVNLETNQTQITISDWLCLFIQKI